MYEAQNSFEDELDLPKQKNSLLLKLLSNDAEQCKCQMTSKNVRFKSQLNVKLKKIELKKIIKKLKNNKKIIKKYVNT